MYADAQKRQERYDKIYSYYVDPECTFKPEITQVNIKEPKYSLHQPK